MRESQEPSGREVLGDSGRLATMSQVRIAEILKLSPEERLRLVELIWESLSASPVTVPLSDAHRSVIDERLAEHERYPEDVVSRDEVLAAARRG
jgi:putative addiction module component (TIGR02574 family)